MKRNLSRLLAIGALALALGPVVDAQNRNDDGGAFARSLDLQTTLRNIDTNREAAASHLLAQWDSYVNQDLYDLRSELGPVIARAPAWQVYGAALAGDLHSMISVLRGTKSAAAYINAEKGAEPKTAAGFDRADPLVLGDTNNQLVFTPIAPCRVVDTRGSGARTGILAANTSRSFDLTTSAFTSGQGGAAACAGLPSFSHLGWAVTITATGYTGDGWFTVYPFGGAVPTASVLNFDTSVYAVASGANLTGCFGCADDITVVSAAAASHVIIDVVGYFGEATAATSAVTRVAGTAGNLAAGGQTFFNGGTCPAGTQLVSGEVDHDQGDLTVGEFSRVGAAMSFWMVNNSGGASQVRPYSVCIETPVQALP